MFQKTTVVNLHREKCDFKICRGSLLGNPYVIGVDGTREQVIERYKEWFKFLLKSKVFRDELAKLKGKKLGCFCKQPDKEIACHGDTIANYLDNGTV